MPGRFGDVFVQTFAEMREDFEKQFLACRETQQPEYWLKELGLQLQKVRDEVMQLSPDEVSVEGVLNLIAYVAAMAAVSDFYLAMFTGAE
jgi:hypothetical protein